MNVAGMVSELNQEIQKLETARQTLLSLDGGRKVRGGKRHLSAAARRKIAQAQKLRWKKWHAKKAA